MKNLIALSVLSLAASAALAQATTTTSTSSVNRTAVTSTEVVKDQPIGPSTGTSVGLTYDMNRANTNPSGFKVDNEVRAFIAQDTAVGTFDLGALYSRLRGQSNYDNAYGFEVGYGNGVKIGDYGLNGRIAYGRLNSIDPNGGGFTGNASYASAAIEATAPIDANTNAFVGYRHRNGLNSNTPNQNRYIVGVDYQVTKEIAVRGGFAHTRQADIVFNGFTTALVYKF
jgi:hypothetical protein